MYTWTIISNQASQNLIKALPSWTAWSSKAEWNSGLYDHVVQAERWLSLLFTFCTVPDFPFSFKPQRCSEK